LGSPQVEARYGMKLTHKFAAPDSRKAASRSPHGRERLPQAIKLIDAEGRSCICVPISQNGKVVDSQGYILGLDDD
jgi:hypothetical protein